ncbi:ATP-binding cassette domain-containing protein, partial [Escherichia coli]|uniref:ATP-binding cassette domain-containing protein n=1 Tax=Escherichia coli TaxID=562 RepID=UPI001928237D
VVTLIGSSGSGKTTLLRCVNMLEEFQGGQILLDGESIGYDEVNGKRVRHAEKVIARHRAMTGMAFQQFNLFPHLTALQNVTLGLLKVKKCTRTKPWCSPRNGWSASACWSGAITFPVSCPAASNSAW